MVDHGPSLPLYDTTILASSRLSVPASIWQHPPPPQALVNPLALSLGSGLAPHNADAGCVLPLTMSSTNCVMSLEWRLVHHFFPKTPTAEIRMALPPSTALTGTGCFSTRSHCSSTKAKSQSARLSLPLCLPHRPPGSAAGLTDSCRWTVCR